MINCGNIYYHVDLDDIPPELLLYILLFVGEADYGNISSLSKYYMNIINRHKKYIFTTRPITNIVYGDKTHKYNYGKLTEMRTIYNDDIGTTEYIDRIDNNMVIQRTRMLNKSIDSVSTYNDNMVSEVHYASRGAIYFTKYDNIHLVYFKYIFGNIVVSFDCVAYINTIINLSWDTVGKYNIRNIVDDSDVFRYMYYDIRISSARVHLFTEKIVDNIISKFI